MPFAILEKKYSNKISFLEYPKDKNAIEGVSMLLVKATGTEKV